MHCTNCGARLEGRPTLCDTCLTDPLIPMEQIERDLERYRFRRPDRIADALVRDPSEGSALAVAVLLALVLSVVLSGLTFGLFLLLLAFGVVMIQFQIRRDVALAVDIRHWPDPRLYNLVKVACYRVGVPIPRTVIKQSPVLNAYTTGFWDTNIVVLHSGLVQACTAHEVLSVIGHELGHIRFRHVTWGAIANPARGQPGAGLLAVFLGWAFNGWSLRREYTADRAGLLATGELDPCLRVEIRLAMGQDPGEHPDVERYFPRVSEDGLDAVVEHMNTHPFPHHRVAALIRTWNDPAWQQKVVPSVRPAQPA